MVGVKASNGLVLLEILCSESEILQALIEHMQSEHEDADWALSDQHMADKAELLDQLESATAHRMHWLEEQGFSADKAGMDSCMESYADDPAVMAQLNVVSGLAEECQHMNQLLARSNLRQQDFYSRLLANVGLSREDKQGCYEPAGTMAASHESQMIEQA